MFENSNRNKGINVEEKILKKWIFSEKKKQILVKFERKDLSVFTILVYYLKYIWKIVKLQFVLVVRWYTIKSVV